MNYESHRDVLLRVLHGVILPTTFKNDFSSTLQHSFPYGRFRSSLFGKKSRFTVYWSRFNSPFLLLPIVSMSWVGGTSVVYLWNCRQIMSLGIKHTTSPLYRRRGGFVRPSDLKCRVGFVGTSTDVPRFGFRVGSERLSKNKARSPGQDTLNAKEWYWTLISFHFTRPKLKSEV